MDLPPIAPELGHDSAVVVDISKVSSAELGQLKRDTDVRWWLELGDQLVLVGDKGELLAGIPTGRTLGAIENLDIGRLRLHGRGCVHQDSTPGSLIAQGGRWELRLLSPGEPIPEVSDDSAHESVWREVVPNSVIAWRYRPDPMGPGADPLILPIVDSINGARWFGDVETLAGWDRSSYGPELAFSRSWIETQFSSLGLEVSAPAFTMPISGGGQITINNVLGRWTGTRSPDEWVIVGGHYDSRNQNISSTVDTPGAEDNASGCSGVIEVARALLAFKPERSILFMCYAGEEQGLYGSKAHVQTLQSAGNLSKVQAVVIMDMIGYSAGAQLDMLLESSSTWTSYLNQFAAAAAIYEPSVGVTLSTSFCCSDHAPYINAGRRSLLTIEKDWNIYPHYHRTTDLPLNMGIHAQAMGSAIMRTNVAVLAELSGASDRIFADSLDPTTP
ncbi:M28 family metallopeptidase [Dokdonella sp.]|uniref:M28 family metallopeptidase n=1 Tax=Dokdonella sp. TaxID=2291710 RepID=UPI003528C951